MGTVFDGEPNPKFRSLMQGSRGSQVFEKNTFPQHLRSDGHSEALRRGAGNRAGARRGGRQSPGAGREEGRPTWTTGSGGGRARPISAARGGPGLSRPARLQAGLRTAGCARPGRGAPTPRGAAARPQEWSRAGASAAAAFLRQFRTCPRRDLGTFPVSPRRRWATPGAPAGRWHGEHPPAPVRTSAPRPGRASPTWLRL